MSAIALHEFDVCEGVRGTYSADQTLRIISVPSKLPPHAAAKTFGFDVISFEGDDRGIVVADHRLATRVIAPAGHDTCENDKSVITSMGLRGSHTGVLVNGSARLWKDFVVPNTVFPASRSDAVIGSTRASSGVERSPVDRHAHDNLTGSDALTDVVGNGLVSIERSRGGV